MNWNLVALLLPYAAALIGGVGLDAWRASHSGALGEAKREIVRLEGERDAAVQRANLATSIASSNEDKAKQLAGQAARDAKAFDTRLAGVRAEAERQLASREAVARAEGEASVLCASPESPLRSALTGRAKAAPRPVPAEIEAAIDAISPPNRRARR